MNAPANDRDLLLRMEARWVEAQEAYKLMNKAIVERHEALKALSDKIKACGEARDLILREGHDRPDVIQAYSQVVKLTLQIDKLETQKVTTKKFHDGMVSRRESILHELLSTTSDQLSLLPPEVSLVASLPVEGVLVVPGEILYTRDGEEWAVIGFKADSILCQGKDGSEEIDPNVLHRASPVAKQKPLGLEGKPGVTICPFEHDDEVITPEGNIAKVIGIESDDGGGFLICVAVGDGILDYNASDLRKPPKKRKGK